MILSSASGLDIIVEGGMPAPDGLGVFSQFFQAPSINETGDMLFSARVYNDTTGTFQTALFLRKANGDLETVLKPGDPVPGSATGATFEFPSAFALADDGTILFAARSSENTTSVVRIVGGVPEVLLVEGSQIDLGNGVKADVSSIGIDPDFIRSSDDFLLNISAVYPSIFDENSLSLTRQTDFFVLRSFVPPDEIGVVPVPASVVLIFTGFAALGGLRQARRRRV